MSDDLSGATAAAAVDDGPKKIMTVIVIGTTGTGKSSLCNLFAGKAHDDNGFPVGNKPQHPNEGAMDELLATPAFRMLNTDAMKKTLLANGAPAPTPRTDKITAKTVYWKGNVKRPVHLIDTPGMIMEDSGADRHGQPTRNLRAQMEECLRKAGHVNVFLLVIDGSRPLLGDQLDVVLRAYKDMFGRRFLQKKGVLAVTNWPRADSFRITEEQMRNELNTFLKYKRFIDFSIPVVFIDAISPLDEEMTKLWNMLLEIPIPSMIS